MTLVVQGLSKRVSLDMEETAGEMWHPSDGCKDLLRALDDHYAQWRGAVERSFGTQGAERIMEASSLLSRRKATDGGSLEEEQQGKLFETQQSYQPAVVSNDPLPDCLPTEAFEKAEPIVVLPSKEHRSSRSSRSLVESPRRDSLSGLASMERPSHEKFSKPSAGTAAMLGLHDIGGFQGFLRRRKNYIDYMAGLLVLLNSFVMMLELELEGRAVGAAQFGLANSGPDLASVEPVFRTIDAIFVYVFLAELIIRVLIERLHFFYDFANWFDLALVTVGVLDLLVFVPLSDTGEPQNIVVMRLVRVVKSLRAIRMVRTLRLFRGLNLLVKACQCFLPSLGWSMVLLVVFMSMGTLVMGNLLRDFITDKDANMDDRLWIYSRYGTAYHAMYTLYEITFAGNWPTNARPVLEKVNHSFVIFYVIYITIIVFAVIRVISATFLKDTLDAAQNDAENLVVERLRKKAQYVKKLEEVFMAIDQSGDGMISEERLANILSNPKAVAYFQTLDVDVTESAALFHLIDNGDGEVTLDEFIEGIMRCKGPARAIDQVAMRALLQQVDHKLSKLTKKLVESGTILPKLNTSPSADSPGIW